MHRRDLQVPVVVERMRQVGVQAAVGAVLPAPGGAEVGRARQAQVGTRRVARQAVHEGTALRFFRAGADAHACRGRDVVFQRAVESGVAAVHVVDERMLVLVVDQRPTAQRALGVERAAGIDLGAVAVPRARAHFHRRGAARDRALAHQVHGAAGVPFALQQARRTAQHLGAVVNGHARTEVAGPAVHAAVQRHTVELDRRQVEAARVDVLAALRALGDRDAGGAGQGVVDVGEVLLVQQLPRDDADRLRDVLERLLALADGDRPRGVRAGALGGGAAFGVGRDRDLGQVLARARPCSGGQALDGHQVALEAPEQPAAGQQPVERLARTQRAAHGRRGAAGHGVLLHRQLQACLPRPVVERLGQRL